MAGTIKGMTIEIGGDTAPLEQALKSTNKEINTTQKELNEVNKLLKLDPSNTVLVKQKQELLAQQIGQTTTKLDALKQAQSKLDAEMKNGGQVNQEEYRKLEREIVKTETSLKGLKDEAKNVHPQLDKVKEGLKKIGETATTTLKAGLDLSVAGMKAMAGAVTAVTGVLGKLAIDAGKTADDLNTMAKTTGLSTKELQEFAYASDLIDVSVETLSGALKKTTASMVSAQSGTGKQAEAFKKLGVSITDAQGQLRDNNDVFQDAIKALGQVGNETERDAIAMSLFGKSATELNPLIEGGIDQLAEMSKQANELGLILSQEALDGANAFNDQIDILKANGKATFNVIGTEIASQLTPAMETLNAETMQVIKSLIGALKEGGLEGLMTEISAQIGNVMTKLTEALPKIARAGIEIVKAFVNTIKDNSARIAQAGGELVATLISGFFEVLPDLIETAIMLVANFAEAIAENLPTLIPKITDAIISIGNVIADKIDFIIEAGLMLFSGLAQGLLQAVPKIIGELPKILTQIVISLIEYIPQIVETVGTIIIAVADTIGNSADTLVPALIDGIMALVDCIIDNLPMIIDTIVTVVIAIADALVNNIDKIIEGAVQLIIGLAQGLVNAIPKLVERLPEIITAIVNGLIVLAPKLLEVADKLINSLGQGIIQALAGLAVYLGELAEFILNNIKNDLKGIFDIGKNLVKGLWDGIKGSTQWLIDKIKSFCKDALGAIKSFFGIESPSRVMANEVGKYMAQGIGVGFGNTIPSVIDAMQQKLSGVTDAFQTQLTFGDIPQLQGNTIVSENSYVTKNYSNTIETVRQPQTVELVLDGTKLARTLIQPLDNEYNRLGVKI